MRFASTCLGIVDLFDQSEWHQHVEWLCDARFAVVEQITSKEVEVLPGFLGHVTGFLDGARVFDVPDFDLRVLLVDEAHGRAFTATAVHDLERYLAESCTCFLETLGKQQVIRNEWNTPRDLSWFANLGAPEPQ